MWALYVGEGKPLGRAALDAVYGRALVASAAWNTLIGTPSCSSFKEQNW